MPEFLELTVDKFTFKIATDRLYSPDGLWAKAEDGSVRLGLSDFFQQRNGDVAFAEVAADGDALQAGDEIVAIETIKADISVPLPFAGEITAVNEDLDLEPEKINFDPYGEGWVAVVDPRDWLAAQGVLLTPEAYYERVKIEAEEEVGKE